MKLARAEAAGGLAEELESARDAAKAAMAGTQARDALRRARDGVSRRRASVLPPQSAVQAQIGQRLSALEEAKAQTLAIATRLRRNAALNG